MKRSVAALLLLVTLPLAACTFDPALAGFPGLGSSTSSLKDTRANPDTTDNLKDTRANPTNNDGLRDNRMPPLAVRGEFRAPASVLSNNSGSYRIMTVDPEVPVPGATVELVDAAGVAVASTSTDATGSFLFEDPIATGNVLVRARFRSKGHDYQLMGIARASDSATSSFGLASSLSTSKILSAQGYAAMQKLDFSTYDQLLGSISAQVDQTLAAVQGGSADPSLPTMTQLLGGIDATGKDASSASFFGQGAMDFSQVFKLDTFMPDWSQMFSGTATGSWDLWDPTNLATDDATDDWNMDDEGQWMTQSLRRR